MSHRSRLSRASPPPETTTVSTPRSARSSRIASQAAVVTSPSPVRPSATNALIDSHDTPAALTDLVPIDRLPALSLFDNPLQPAEVDRTVSAMTADPAAFRVVRHASGPVLVFNRRGSHVLLLRDDGERE